LSIIKVEGISKKYELGHIVSHKKLTNPLQRGWQRLMVQKVNPPGDILLFHNSPDGVAREAALGHPSGRRKSPRVSGPY